MDGKQGGLRSQASSHRYVSNTQVFKYIIADRGGIAVLTALHSSPPGLPKSNAAMHCPSRRTTRGGVTVWRESVGRHLRHLYTVRISVQWLPARCDNSTSVSVQPPVGRRGRELARAPTMRYNGGMIETPLLLEPALAATHPASDPSPLLEELATIRLGDAVLRAENAALQDRIRELVVAAPGARGRHSCSLRPPHLGRQSYSNLANVSL